MADIVILNGRVITFSGSDAEAVAITDGLIEAVGSNRDIQRIAGSAEVIDANGATVLPGFIDSHVHLFGGSAALDYLNLSGVSGITDLTTIVRKYADSLPADDLIFATAMDYCVTGERNTTRQLLDAVLPNRPFAAIASDLHTVWANTLALEKAGILMGYEAPEGSEVVMGADGKATGELRETGAFGPVISLTKFKGRDLMGYITGKDPLPSPTIAERSLDKTIIARGMQLSLIHI